MSINKPWRQVVSRCEENTEHTSVRGKNFTWWVSTKVILTLDCGHQKIVTRSRGDIRKARCPECAPQQELSQ